MLQMRRVEDTVAEELGDPEIERHEEDEGGKHSVGTWGEKDGEAATEPRSGSAEDQVNGKENANIAATEKVDGRKEKTELEEVEADLAEQSIA